MSFPSICMEAGISLVLMMKIYARRSLLTFKISANISVCKTFLDI